MPSPSPALGCPLNCHREQLHRTQGRWVGRRADVGMAWGGGGDREEWDAQQLSHRRPGRGGLDIIGRANIHPCCYLWANV